MQVLYIGFLGMAMILIAFIMNQLHRWHDDDLIYDSFNAIGALLMVYYSFTISSYPFLILNAVWAAVSLRDVVLDLNPKNKIHTHKIKK
jgi:hypothetical protein